MDTLLGTLRQTRDDLAQRSAKLAGATRDRGLQALKKVRGGALDWRRTLKARRTELGDSTHGFFAFAGLQLRVIDGVDRALASFSDRVRAEMKRLTHLELPRPVSAPAPATAAKRSAPKSSAAPREKKAKAAPASKRLVLPIADYDTLSAKEILAELPRLTEAQCKAVHALERAHKQRKTILAALEARFTG
jgi:hypothetical protein